MKALTIKQPWVYAIFREGKDIENRTWQTSYRGWLAIHSAGQPRRGAMYPGRLLVPDLSTLDYSAVCGVVRLVDIVAKSRSKWFYQPDDGSTNFGWVLADPIPFDRPIKCKGKLNLWNLPEDIAEEISHMLMDVT
jgi:hypothetical protein